MGYGGLEVYLAGYPPRFKYVLRKGFPRMGKGKHQTAQKGLTARWYKFRSTVLSHRRPSRKPASVRKKVLLSAVTYRRSMPVTEYTLYRETFGSESAYFLCPRCDITMEREYQAYCDRCGQHLSWSRIQKAKCRRIP